MASVVRSKRRPVKTPSAFQPVHKYRICNVFHLDVLLQSSETGNLMIVSNEKLMDDFADPEIEAEIDNAIGERSLASNINCTTEERGMRKILHPH
jgi:hypothetical protein